MPLDLPTSAPTGASASNPTSAEHCDTTAAVEAARVSGKEARAAEATHGTRSQRQLRRVARKTRVVAAVD